MTDLTAFRNSLLPHSAGAGENRRKRKQLCFIIAHFYGIFYTGSKILLQTGTAGAKETDRDVGIRAEIGKAPAISGKAAYQFQEAQSAPVRTRTIIFGGRKNGH